MLGKRGGGELVALGATPSVGDLQVHLGDMCYELARKDQNCDIVWEKSAPETGLRKAPEVATSPHVVPVLTKAGIILSLLVLARTLERCCKN